MLQLHPLLQLPDSYTHVPVDEFHRNVQLPVQVGELVVVVVLVVLLVVEDVVEVEVVVLVGKLHVTLKFTGLERTGGQPMFTS